MKNILLLLALASLASVIIPAFFYLAGSLEKPVMQAWMLVGTVAWFITFPIWISHSE